MASIFGVELVPGATYRGRMVVHHFRALSKGPMLRKLEDAGFVGVHLLEPDELPADWPADQRENVDDDWTAFLEGVYAGSSSSSPPDAPRATKDYDVRGFWLHARPSSSADAAAAVTAARARPRAAEPAGVPLVLAGVLAAWMLARRARRPRS